MGLKIGNKTLKTKDFSYLYNLKGLKSISFLPIYYVIGQSG